MSGSNEAHRCFVVLSHVQFGAHAIDGRRVTFFGARRLGMQNLGLFFKLSYSFIQGAGLEDKVLLHAAGKHV